MHGSIGHYRHDRARQLGYDCDDSYGRSNDHDRLQGFVYPVDEIRWSQYWIGRSRHTKQPQLEVWAIVFPSGNQWHNPDFLRRISGGLFGWRGLPVWSHNFSGERGDQQLWKSDARVR